tara:strand:- start:3126 stop:3884 length:759 start_codon:yes stop_codon:yes gene_type:complete
MLWLIKCTKEVFYKNKKELMPLYLYILLVSVSVPMLHSIFVKDFIVHWKNFLISTTVIATIFLVWDTIFTHLGIWGFNEDYCLNIYFLKLPIEEILFFFVIPFCSLFIYYAFYSVLPKVKLPRNLTKFISLFFIVFSSIVVFTHYSKAYTVVNYLFLNAVLLLGLRFNFELLQKFFVTFIIILIPFFIVNGILTGAITDSPIVWYNNSENLGIRFISIPVEDIAYAFSMLFGNLMIFEFLNLNKKKRFDQNK